VTLCGGVSVVQDNLAINYRLFDLDRAAPVLTG
jgi:hypothetical protein